jgi:predicted nucleic acid-binding protein
MSAYGGAYVALADVLDASLLTFDRSLGDTAAGFGVHVVVP